MTSLEMQIGPNSRHEFRPCLPQVFNLSTARERRAILWSGRPSSGSRVVISEDSRHAWVTAYNRSLVLNQKLKVAMVKLDFGEKAL